MTISPAAWSNHAYPSTPGDTSSRIRSRLPGHVMPTVRSRTGRPAVTCSATKPLHSVSSGKLSSTSSPAPTSMVVVAAWSGSRSETNAQVP